MPTMTRTTQARELAIMEIPLAIPLGQAFHAEMKVPGQFIPEVFTKNMGNLMATGDATIFSIWDDLDLVGGLGALVSPDLLDNRLVSTELFWFVDKDYRAISTALRLIHDFHRWSHDKGAVECRLVHLLTMGDDRREDAFSHFYTKLGYRPIEVGWLLSLEEI